MTAEEKLKIFNLLQTAAASENYGIVPQDFASIPDFSDDEIETKSAAPATNGTQEINGAAPATDGAPEIKTSAPATSGTLATNSAAPAENEKKLQSLSELSGKIARCTRCGLARTRNNVVPGQGVENPLVLVIGEGPGYDEDMQGLPFVGKAGVLLDKMLAAIGLDRKTNCFIANIVKCRPPQNRDPLPDEQNACISFLEAQIHILKPKMILCMGRISGHKISQTELPVHAMHGQFYDYHGIPAMVTYHPSALLRDQNLKIPAWDDLKKFRQKLNQIQNS